MPLYEYRCYSCGYRVEVFHAADLDECPKCHSRSWTRVPSAPNFKVVGGTPKFHGDSNETADK